MRSGSNLSTLTYRLVFNNLYKAIGFSQESGSDFGKQFSPRKTRSSCRRNSRRSSKSSCVRVRAAERAAAARSGAALAVAFVSPPWSASAQCGQMAEEKSPPAAIVCPHRGHCLFAPMKYALFRPFAPAFTGSVRWFNARGEIPNCPVRPTCPSPGGPQCERRPRMRFHLSWSMAKV